MNIRIEISDDIMDDEVVIRCRQITSEIQHIQQVITKEAASAPQLTFYKDQQEYYFPLKEILFFETSGDNVYGHTRNDVFRMKLRLYELEDILPRPFVRIAKSTIVNIDHIITVHRNLTSSSQIQFHKSHKQVYASRRYYKELSQRLKERSNYER